MMGNVGKILVQSSPKDFNLPFYVSQNGWRRNLLRLPFSFHVSQIKKKIANDIHAIFLPMPAKMTDVKFPYIGHVYRF